MGRHWPSQVIRHIAILTASAVVASCRFGPHIPTIQFSTLPPQPFGEFGPVASQNPESPKAAVERLMGELFDPFNLPGDQPYEGSVFQIMDRTLAGAYEYYGYDLAELAANRQDNPVSEQMFFDYLVAKRLLYATDPASGEQFSAYEWLQRRVGMGAAGVHPNVISEIAALESGNPMNIGALDRGNPMNFEPNYLAALYAAHEFAVEDARSDLQDEMFYYFADDAAAIYQYLSRYKSFGTR